MRNLKFTLLLCLISVSAFFFYSCQKQEISVDAKTRGGFNPPEVGQQSTSATDVSSAIGSYQVFNDSLFAKYYQLSPTDLKHFNSATIAIYNGLIEPNNYTPSNRVFVVVPVNHNYKTIEGFVLCSNGSTNVGQAKQYISNYKSYAGSKDPIRGFVIPKENYCQGNEGLRIHNVINDDVRTVLLTYSPIFTDSRVCPNNCDLFTTLYGTFGKSSWLCPNNCDKY